MAESTSAGPVEETGRITNLDALRGVAVFGILLMNAVSYGLDPAAYFNISLANDSPLDWIIGVFGEVVVDQRFMGVFSLLFGAGIVLFADRADAKGNRGGWLSLWRNLLLLGIGALHMWLWEGDILVAYAIASPFLLLARRLPDRALVALGAALVLLSALVFGLTQAMVDADGAQLGELWFPGHETPDDTVGSLVLFTFFMRALGMMMIGVGLFRSGVLSGERPREYYRRMAIDRAGDRSAAGGARRGDRRARRLRARHRPALDDPEHRGDDSGDAGHLRVDHPLEHARRASRVGLAAAGARRWTDGVDELSDPDDPRHHLPAHAVRARRSEPRLGAAVRDHRVGVAACLVAVVAVALPLWAVRVGLAGG